MATKIKMDLLTTVKMILRGYEDSHIPIDEVLQPYENGLFTRNGKKGHFTCFISFMKTSKNLEISPKNSNLQTLISKL